MARMLEALKRTPDRQAEREVSMPPLVPEPLDEDIIDLEMPFIEVGGPRQAPSPSAGVDKAVPRAATLQMPAPFGVEFRSQVIPTSVPRIGAELIAFHQPSHAVSQQYAALYKQLVPDADGEARIVALTSLASAVGTTTTLLNLAIAGCRQSDHSVVVVDANFAKPAAAARLGLPAAKGLREVLQGSISLEQAIQSTAIQNLHVLPAGTTELGPDPGDALGWILGWLKKRYDAVLIDAPAWSQHEEATFRVLANAADALYLVTDAADAQRQGVRTLMRDLGRLGGRLGGSIVTGLPV